MKVITPATQTAAAVASQATVAGSPKQWDAFPEPKGWSMQWDNSGLVPPQTVRPGKP